MARKHISELQLKIIVAFLPVAPSRRHIDLADDSGAGAEAWRHGAHFRLVRMSNFWAYAFRMKETVVTVYVNLKENLQFINTWM